MKFIDLESTCCFGKEDIEIDALNRFNRTAMVTHDPFEIRFGRL